MGGSVQRLTVRALAASLAAFALLDFVCLLYLHERGGRYLDHDPTMRGGGGHVPFEFRSEGAPRCGPINATDVNVTLATQLSSNRLWMMGHHCVRWGGPLSVAIFTDESVQEVTDIMVEGGCRREQLYVRTLPLAGHRPEDYPVNRLRNMALEGVQTTHVLYVDVDFWASADLRAAFGHPSVRAHLASDPRLALVVPAFQLIGWCWDSEDGCRAEQTAEMPSDLSELLGLMTNGDASMFDHSNYHGHGSTSFGAWLLQRSGELFDIPCIKSDRYEPYLAFRYCDDLPPFQEAFTGYGKNKMAFIMHLRRVGYDFSQLGGGFLVHYPHEMSEAKIRWDKGRHWKGGEKKAQPKFERGGKGSTMKKKKEEPQITLRSTQRGMVDWLFLQFQRWLQSEVPDMSRVMMCDDNYVSDIKLLIDL